MGFASCIMLPLNSPKILSTQAPTLGRSLYGDVLGFAREAYVTEVSRFTSSGSASSALALPNISVK
jgi:hypothetical protein